MNEIIVDNFAGGGGASTGIELAIGRSVDIAINHDQSAIEMHRHNHPDSKHYCEDVWQVDPVEACEGRPVGLAWFSPDCKHFSKAKGGKPVEKKIRGLAWIVLKWAGKVRPRVIMLENVEEFKTWGPIRNGRPVKSKKGETFRLWREQLESLGYKVESRELKACDYGAPTTRRRLFIIARRDGKPIVWPEPTHAEKGRMEVMAGLMKPYRTASEIIDWSIPCPSIFTRSKPLSDNTLQRIARGIEKFIIHNEDPFILDDKACFLQHYYGTQGDETRGSGLDEPVATLTTANRFGLVTAFITRQFTQSIGHDLTEPTATATTVNKSGLVTAFLLKYYGNELGQDIKGPLHTITTKDRFGLVTVRGEKYQITDIGMRMLQPRELYNAQGFPGTYYIDGVGKVEQVKKVGNSVSPVIPKALVEANLPEMCMRNAVIAL